ncbi:MAG: extracellular solute-binding protein [Leptolyngbyaceae cyanobacterium]
MDRRSLLLGLAALAVAQTACGRSHAGALAITTLKDALPPQLLSDFKDSLTDPAPLKVRTQKSWVSLWQTLQEWHQANAEDSLPSPVADWVCVSDYWLFAAIQQQLILPLSEVRTVPGWENLPESWSTLLQRNSQGFVSETGTVWASPYRWGSLVMVYDSRPFAKWGWQPTAWSDLLRPELRQRLALPNHPRIVLGLLLKSLGYSVNDLDPETHGDLRSMLDALVPQVRVYATSSYLESLIVGDVALAVGWSAEIQPVLSRYRYLKAIAPDPGTLLSADVWVKPNPTMGQPQETSPSPIDQKWLSYWWSPKVVTPLSLFARGLSPLLLSPDSIQVAVTTAETAIAPTSEQLAQSEFILPLEAAAIARYEALWRQLRGRK